MPPRREVRLSGIVDTAGMDVDRLRRGRVGNTKDSILKFLNIPFPLKEQSGKPTIGQRDYPRKFIPC